MGIRGLLAGGVVLVGGAVALSLYLQRHDDAPVPATISIPLPASLEGADPELTELIQAKYATVEQQPSDPAAWVELGLVYQANENIPLAITCYEKAVELQSRCSPCWYHLSLSRADNGDLNGAVEAVQQALAANDEYPPAHWRLGYWHMELGDTDAAEASFNRAMELDPRDPAAWFGLVRVQMSRGDNEAALETLESVMAWSEVNQAYGRQLMATLYRRLGRLDDAQRMIELGTSEPKGWPDPVAAESRRFERGNKWKIEKARQMIAQGRANEAARLLEDAIERQPESAALLNNLGVIYRILDRLEDSAAALEQSLSIRPGYDEAHFNLGLVRMLQLEREPGAMIEGGLALDADALAHADEALEINPMYGSAHGLRGQVLEYRGLMAEALDAYVKAAANSSGPDGVHWMHQQGRLLLSLGQVNNAITVLEAAMTKAPTHAEMLMDLVRAEIAAGQFDDAERDLGQLRQLRPSDPRLAELGALLQQAKESGTMFPSISGTP